MELELSRGRNEILKDLDRIGCKQNLPSKEIHVFNGFWFLLMVLIF